MSPTRTPPTNARGPLREEALQALRNAVGKVIQEHKRLGIPLVIWRDGKVVEISPEEAEAEYLAAKARAEAEARRTPSEGSTPNDG
ncbi:MAG: hypothetical protein HYS12_25340 [Planctomycetes bacterium]|nr:hypothetical protein [Planctomycetota bacterium]